LSQAWEMLAIAPTAQNRRLILALSDLCKTHREAVAENPKETRDLDAYNARHPFLTKLGDALLRINSAKRFGARIVQDKVFEDTGGARRTDSGVVQIQRQLPVFTQGAPAYDVLVAADDGA